jgi:hypothetical protein
MKGHAIARIAIVLLAVSAFPLKPALAERTKAECAPVEGLCGRAAATDRSIW